METLLYFFKLGFFHVLDWFAYDHILFLAVLLLAYSFNDWIKTLYLITAVTIGHSITLLLATYNVVRVKLSYIEFMIPVTIFVFAIYNVFTAGKIVKNGKYNFMIMIALFFGCIHGLGFAHGFDKIIGNHTKFISLLEFSLGIEAAQLGIAIVLFFIGLIFKTLFRFSNRDWTLVISSIIIGLVIPILIANKIW
jgi:ABC-type nickel/cobalt efflux system permease component RcnA